MKGKTCAACKKKKEVKDFYLRANCKQCMIKDATRFTAKKGMTTKR